MLRDASCPWKERNLVESTEVRRRPPPNASTSKGHRQPLFSSFILLPLSPPRTEHTSCRCAIDTLSGIMPPTPLPPAPAPPAPAKDKRPVSISASAFAFSLATPAKQTARLPLKAGPAPGRPQETPTRAQGQVRPFEQRPGPEDAGPSRPSYAEPQTTTPAPARVVHTRVAPPTDLTPLRPATPLLRPLAHLVTPLPARAVSPLDKSGTDRGKRKLNDVLDESSPFRPRFDTAPRSEAADGAGSGDARTWRALRGVSELPSAYSLPEAVRDRKEENEGLGVSPRRTKGIIKWTGRG
jgi:hypothetical protein